MAHRLSLFVGLVTVATCFGATPSAQDRLKTMPGYDRFERISREIPGSVKLGTLAVRWKEDGSSFEYAWNGRLYRFVRRGTQQGDGYRRSV